jgi:TolB-like protein/DNA-binding winged helix-turn-helix (wHTH) protein/Flp pilus assembly protein TadD
MVIRMESAGPRESFRFREYELDVAGYQLRRHGRPVRIERQPMDLLILLVKRRQQLVSRGEIVDLLWGKGVFVDVETGVHTAMRKIRQALHDSPDDSRFIETVPGKGYRFVAPVEVVDVSAGPLVASNALAEAVGAAAATPVVPEGVSVRGDNARAPISRAAVVTTLIAVALLAGLAVWAWRRADATGPAITIAVLPFENLSGDAERDYLADGLTEETVATLGQTDPERLQVVGRTSLLEYQRATKSLAAILSDLNVDYLVESSLRAEADRFRITSKLIRVRDQVQLWSESYDRESGSMLGLQQELSRAIAGQVRLRLTPERLDALARRQTSNAEAYDLYLRGLNFTRQRTPATTRRAIEYFQRATTLDPDYALAWAGIAHAYSASLVNGDAPPLDVRPRAMAAVAQATRTGAVIAEAQSALAAVNWRIEWNWPAAETALRRAIALDSSNSIAHQMLGHLLSQMGRHAEALPAMRRARELDPLYAMPHAISSQVAFQRGDVPMALEHARQAIALDSEFWIGHMMLGQAYGQQGQYDMAVEALTAAARFSGANSKPMSLRGYLLAKAGRPDEARAILATLEAASRQRYVPPYAFALIHAGLGETDTVFEWLDRAYAARDVHLMYLTVDPKWDPYRADPRFAALLARCDFMRTATSAPPTT